MHKQANWNCHFLSYIFVLRKKAARKHYKNTLHPPICSACMFSLYIYDVQKQPPEVFCKKKCF